MAQAVDSCTKIRPGDRFGRLVAVERIKAHNPRRIWWKCACDCGYETVVQAKSIVYGLTKSCGCFRVEHSSMLGQRTVKHGMHNSAEYRIWSGMRSRCNNARDADHFEDYGGRGITVCARWEKFENFFADMGYRPSRKHSLDRIDNDGNYEPGNCQWATPSQQRRNQRRRFKDLAGKAIGTYTVVRLSHLAPKGHPHWVVRGQNGVEHTRSGSFLKALALGSVISTEKRAVLKAAFESDMGPYEAARLAGVGRVAAVSWFRIFGWTGKWRISGGRRVYEKA